jgi:cell wall assembly regulator SMI1
MNKKMVYRIEIWPIHRLTHDAQDSLPNPTGQITQIRSMRRSGVVNPALVYRDSNIISGHARILTASQFRLASLTGNRRLTEAQPRALPIAGNKFGDNARWDLGAGHRSLTETKTNTNEKDNQ